MSLELKRPQAHDYINQRISIKAVDGEITFEVEILRETLEKVFSLDGNDSHAVLRAIDRNWEAIEEAVRKKFEGRVTESSGWYRLLDQDFR